MCVVLHRIAQRGSSLIRYLVFNLKLPFSHCFLFSIRSFCNAFIMFNKPHFNNHFFIGGLSWKLKYECFRMGVWKISAMLPSEHDKKKNQNLNIFNSGQTGRRLVSQIMAWDRSNINISDLYFWFSHKIIYIFSLSKVNHKVENIFVAFLSRLWK